MTDSDGTMITDPLLVASDIGGTFTDTVTIAADGTIGRYKAASVPDDPAAGVLATLELAATDAGTDVTALLNRVSLFAHGTTVATNAMLEGKTARVGLLQTRGFGDTLSIMRGFKSFGLDEDQVKNFRSMVKQELVVPKRCIREVSERVDYRGRVRMPLDEDGVRRALAELVEEGVEVIAVALLWAFRNDVHERRIGQIIEEEMPDALYTLSSDLLPRLGEYQRSLTTAVNASLRPVLRRAVSSLEVKLREHGLSSEPLLMQSNGGLARVSEIDREAASTVMSGPVGGVVACQNLGELRDNRNIVATDMGGTSFEVGLILNGRAHIANSTWVGRHELALPSVAVRTVGAGSGSIARVAHGLLTVGPESAGAVPGPACYGRGGTEPTVADADLVLGYINPTNFLAGRLELDVATARRALATHIAEPLDLSVEEAAEGIKTIIDGRMADLVRTATIEQGYDPSDFVLYAYGGAGPSHAFSYGAELRTDEIVVPLTASVHSAFGVASSDLTVAAELSDPLLSPPGTEDYAAALPAAEINDRLKHLTDRARERLRVAGARVDDMRVMLLVEMRFRFQIHVLSIPVPEQELDDDGVRDLVSRFVRTYEARFGEGSAFEAAGVEITTFKAVATIPTTRPRLRKLDRGAANGQATESRRQVFQRGEWHEARVINHHALHPGLELHGLSIIDMPDTTIAIGADQSAVVDDYGNVIIRPAK
jgi:N-methylhydantoinase A